MSTGAFMPIGAERLLRIVIAISVASAVSCHRDSDSQIAPSPSQERVLDDNASPQVDLESTPASSPEEEKYRQARSQMVARQLAARDIVDKQVLEAMGRVPRHRFVPEGQRDLSYVDSPLPIGQGQTISQPYIVALMTQLVAPSPTAKALDVGTGSGYQAAVLAELVKTVYSIEILEPLANEARGRLKSLGYQNIQVRHGDGYRGWPEHEPFDIIIVAAAPDHVPQSLVDQLARGGKMVIPVGGRFGQTLLVLEKDQDGTVTRRNVAPVAFVPMTGEAQE